jgi:hypothetical protein
LIAKDFAEVLAVWLRSKVRVALSTSPSLEAISHCIKLGGVLRIPTQVVRLIGIPFQVEQLLAVCFGIENVFPTTVADHSL